jgi:hypothetical protein
VSPHIAIDSPEVNLHGLFVSAQWCQYTDPLSVFNKRDSRETSEARESGVATKHPREALWGERSHVEKRRPAFAMRVQQMEINL